MNSKYITFVMTYIFDLKLLFCNCHLIIIRRKQ